MAVLIALAVISGCGAPPPLNVSPRGGHPARDLVRTPRVQCVGTELCNGLVAAVGSSLWGCEDCARGATSGDTLAALPLALAARPEAVVILTGSYDVDDPGWEGACNLSGAPAVRTCDNVTAIITALTERGVPYVMGTIPNRGDGTTAEELAPDYTLLGVALVQANIFDFNRDAAMFPQYLGGGVLVDYYDALGNDYLDGTGVDLTPAGYRAMVELTLPAIQKLNVGGTK